MGDGARRLRLPAGPLARLLQPDGAFRPPPPPAPPAQPPKRKRKRNEQAAEPPKVLLAHPPPKPTLTAHLTCGECPTPQPSPSQAQARGGSSSEAASEARAPGTQSLPPGWTKVTSKSGKTVAGYSDAEDGTTRCQTIKEAWEVHM